MNGIRTLVLQDLSHVLPPKGVQLHTTASSRRFWNFFEFSLKEDATHPTTKRCSSTKDIVSSSLISTNELECASRNRASLSANSTVPSNMNPRIHICRFDLKSHSADRPKVPRPLSQPDNLVSLLDGNPVPKTMKWKLKGYKTLRHEQSSEFAFVPGANCYDLDILSRNEHDACPSKDTVNGSTLSLTTKAIENKENVAKIERTEPDVTIEETLEAVSKKTTEKLLTTGATKKEDQFLPISKAESSVVNQASYRSQPSVQYSSRPPKKISKPMPPGTSMDERLVNDTRKPPYAGKPAAAPTAESYQQQTSESYSSTAGESSLNHVEVSESTGSEWSSMEPRLPDKEETRTSRFSSSTSETPANELPNATFPRPTDQSTYFAPRPWKHSKLPASSLNSEFDARPVYESILDVRPKNNSIKITNPHENQPARTSPCAATQARLQRGSNIKELQTGSKNESRRHPASSSGFDGSSVSGGSGGGSRKPPASYPPFTARRSSSNTSCLTRKALEDSSGKPANKNSSSNISTSSATFTPKKCGDRDEMSEGRVICTKPRQNKCGRQRKCEKNRKSKKVCKRYCCPALQMPVGCDFSQNRCPKKGNGCGKSQQQAKKETATDPTCLPDETEKDQGREICTKPRKRRRECSKERRRSCDQERSCSRNRSRSCQRQERRDCSRNREDQGREICTKPRRRDSCNRRTCNDRSCNRRATKCTGRRNYTHSAYIGRRKSSQNMKRYSSLPAFAFSLIGMKPNNESKQKLVDSPAKGRFYGKKETPPSCKRPERDDKCKKPASNTEVKCKAPPKIENKCGRTKRTERKCEPVTKTENTCKPTKKLEGIRMETKKTESKCGVKKSESICKPVKKTESICKPVKKTESICKPVKKTESKCKPVKKTESICKPVKKTESKCKPVKKTEYKCKTSQKRQESCKTRSKSDDYCAKRREQMCKGRKSTTSTSAGESMKERIEREKKEMEECKKHIKSTKKDKGKKMEEKVTTTGLERVVSPCKQKQSGKCEKDPSKKMSCIGVPFNCLINNTVANTVASMPENKLFGILPDRSYSVMRNPSFDEIRLEKTRSVEGQRFWAVYDEDDFGADPIPAPVTIENQEEPLNENNYSKSNWFLSWFNNNHP